MDIYHTKKQTENIPRSCSYLLLKTLFYFISQCTSAPYLESGCVILIRSWTTAILLSFSQETDLLMKAIMKCVNIKLWDILGCFHYILNAPRICTFPISIWYLAVCPRLNSPHLYLETRLFS